MGETSHALMFYIDLGAIGHNMARANPRMPLLIAVAWKQCWISKHGGALACSDGLPRSGFPYNRIHTRVLSGRLMGCLALGAIRKWGEHGRTTKHGLIALLLEPL